MSEPWWKTGIIYQIYPRSYGDSNGDGQGDLRGIITHLDHLQRLGVDAIWMSPTMPSPNADWGYDVADYCAVHPDFGTLEDFDLLVSEARARGIRVMLDLVPNHTSDQHAWFLDSRSSKTSRYRDWYVWADPKPDGSPPNNWVGSFGGPAWSLDEHTGQYYLHNFLPGQPDLNWWNDELRDAFDDILRFWFDRGVAGFRIDVCQMVIKDKLLRDNPPATDDDPWIVRMFGQRSVYNANRPEVHDVVRRWRALADSYDPPRVLVGETSVDDVATMVTFYGLGHDELHLAFNFPMINAKFEAVEMSGIVAMTEALLPLGAWPVWVGSNHDFSHLATRWAGGDPAKARAAMVMLLSLRGTTVLYQGDEIGMPDTELTKEQLLDPVGLRYWPYPVGRDPERTPMPWTGEAGAGFTAAGVEPWLPFGDVAACNVADQEGVPDSHLTLVRDLIALRKVTPDLQVGDYAPVPPDGSGLWAWRRGGSTFVAVNISDGPVSVPDIRGTVLIGTDRGRDGCAVPGSLDLGPWEAVIVALGA